MSRLSCVLALLPLCAAAAPDQRLPAVVCVPGDTTTMQYENKPLTAGTVTKEGRTTPPRVYFCPVVNPDPRASLQQWPRMEMTYADNTGVSGNVVLSLYAKSLAALSTDPPLGTTVKLASIHSLPSTGVTRVSATLPAALDFSRYTYWWVLELKSPTTGNAVKIDVHELALVN